MIIDAIISALAALVAWVFSLMPRVPIWNGQSVSLAVSGFVSWMGPGLTALNYYVPVYWWLQLLVVIVGLEIAHAGFAVVKFVISIVRGVGLG